MEMEPENQHVTKKKKKKEKKSPFNNSGNVLLVY